MAFTDKLQEIDRLQEQISSHGKLPAEVLKKINYKFRLEWNFTSNRMEGNTLTREETRSVMVGNIDVHLKPFTDLLEVKMHDDVITKILKIGKSELNLSEGRIREIHKAIMHEEDQEKARLIGRWKEVPNEIINYKKEKFEFVLPSEVPEQMHRLMNWLNTEKEKIDRKAKNAIHPVEMALAFHLEYITIHPFYDGNGRTARIFTNLILIAYGYPPLYIKENESEVYYQYLGDIQCYGGSPDLFYDFMAGLVIRSQQLVLDAIEGKEIAEQSDLDRGIELLKKRLEAVPGKTEEAMENLLNSYIPSLLESFDLLISKFSGLFENTTREYYITVDGGESRGSNLEHIFARVLTVSSYQKIERILLQATLKRMIRSGHHAHINLGISFGLASYNITSGHIVSMTKRYNETLTIEESEEIISKIGNHLLEELNNVQFS